jgi:hypothetical protein
MCEANDQPNKAESANQRDAASLPWPDWDGFDPDAPLKWPSRVVDVTADVLSGKRTFFGVTGASAVQIIGGVRTVADTK